MHSTLYCSPPVVLCSPYCACTSTHTAPIVLTHPDSGPLTHTIWQLHNIPRPARRSIPIWTVPLFCVINLSHMTPLYCSLSESRCLPLCFRLTYYMLPSPLYNSVPAYPVLHSFPLQSQPSFPLFTSRSRFP